LASILVLGVIISVGYFTSNYVLASDNTPHDQLITRIAQKFNLKESDVEAVFTAVRDERMEQMEKLREERLDQAVKDGVLTEVQKNALLTKMKEHQGERKQNREEMQSWFKSQGIDETKLRSYLGFGNGRDNGRRMGR
jgi:restriction endonuclease